mmetsp:Transcript_8343/g.18573  ORF Transcript_8343/g.18573 Transcript_8343/m.18573 type:complete len:213 (-) Transcript_8343:1918-2556(-)
MWWRSIACDLVLVRPDRGLCSSAHADDLQLRRVQPRAARLGEPRWQLKGNPIATHEDQPQSVRKGKFAELDGSHEKVDEGRYGVPEGDLLLLGDRSPEFGVWGAHGRRRRNDDGSAYLEKSKDVIDGKIERQRRQSQTSIALRDLPSPVQVPQGVHRTQVMANHALGLSRRAGRVDQVGRIRRRHLALRQARQHCRRGGGVGGELLVHADNG